MTPLSYVWKFHVKDTICTNVEEICKIRCFLSGKKSKMTRFLSRKVIRIGCETYDYPRIYYKIDGKRTHRWRSGCQQSLFIRDNKLWPHHYDGTTNQQLRYHRYARLRLPTHHVNILPASSGWNMGHACTHHHHFMRVSTVQPRFKTLLLLTIRQAY